MRALINRSFLSNKLKSYVEYLFSSTTKLGREAVGELKTVCFFGDRTNLRGDAKLDFDGEKLTFPGEHGKF